MRSRTTSADPASQMEPSAINATFFTSATSDAEGRGVPLPLFDPTTNYNAAYHHEAATLWPPPRPVASGDLLRERSDLVLV